ncbi:MAG: hypothetical protein HY744_01115 [Deltaproteobacteria bacterium]|nr:hypothetical protein [Deltaproteobacteria bacterium]
MPPVRRPAVWRADSSKPGPERVAEARAAKLGVVQALFAASGVAFPPAQMLLRGFKRDRRLELWAASGRAGALRHVTTYEICYASGDLGPKRREGDAQVPEGFYVLDLYNPSSRFHLSMQVSYPNESDRILGDRSRLGGEIMIHGNCVSIGCLAMSDERIQELWVATTALRDAGGKVHVHIFPARDIDGLLGSGGYGGPEHHDFWRNLKDGKDRFERTRTLPRVRVDPGGRYLFD